MGAVAGLLMICSARPGRRPTSAARDDPPGPRGAALRLTTPDVLFVVILMAAIGCFGYNFQTILPLIAQYVLNAEPPASAC